MRKLLFIIFSLLCFYQMNAQQNIKGVIVDASKVTLPGVTIQIKNTQKGTISDVTGGYSIMAANNDTLVFSMVGMSIQKIPVGDKTIINVKLLEESQQLGEVVVIGYGTVKKSDLTGSVATVKSVDLTKITSLNP